MAGSCWGAVGEVGRQQGKTEDKARMKGAVWDWASGMAAASEELW